jgi:hypothetical protein
MNVITVSLYRRPFHTKLCLESICRAQRWHPWADQILVCLAPNALQDVAKEAMTVVGLNPDTPFFLQVEPADIRNPHQASKWMLDKAFHEFGSDFTLYIEDDVILSPDAFMALEFVYANTVRNLYKRMNSSVVGICLYHETIPEHYLVNPPDPRRLHLHNGVNTCGGTAWLREPYLKILGPNWNCKQVEPLGFDYSAHYLMYKHGLYMVYPDLSRSMNIGFTGGALSQEQWEKYCGKSIWTQTDQALRDWRDFQIDVSEYPKLVREIWMEDELKHRGE